MVLATFDRLTSIVFVVPVIGSPIVILVLQLNPADAIDLRIDKLLMACGAILRSLIHSLVQAVVLRRPASDQKVASDRCDRVIFAPLPEILFGLRNGVVCVSLHVGLLDRVTGEARDAFVVPDGAG